MDEKYKEVVQGVLEGIFSSCLLASVLEDIEPAKLLKDILVNALIAVADQRGDDNALLIVRKLPEGWSAHVHFDYLSSDHDHFAGDFDWNVTEPEGPGDE